ncbi:MAG: hypothetical protein AB7F96_10180 [Beijerinckiaceae bacterium]
MMARPVNLGRTPGALKVRPPARGEHTREILTEFGIDAATIADYSKRNIV